MTHETTPQPERQLRIAAMVVGALAAGLGMARLILNQDPAEPIHHHVTLPRPQGPGLLTPEESHARLDQALDDTIRAIGASPADNIELQRAYSRFNHRIGLEDARSYLRARGIPETAENVDKLQGVIDQLSAQIRAQQVLVSRAVHDHLLQKIEETGDCTILPEGQQPPPWDGSYGQTFRFPSQHRLSGQKAWAQCWPGDSAVVDVRHEELMVLFDYAFDTIREALSTL